MSVLSIWGAVKVAAGAGILQGGYPFARNVYMVGANVPTYAQSQATIAAALAAAVDGDVILLGPQRHQEGNLVLPQGTDNITIIGMGNRGACFIEPANAGDEGLQVLGNDCTLINVGVAGNATGDYGLKVGSLTVSPGRFNAIGCKFYGPTGANPAAAVVLQSTSDVLFDDCLFTTNSNAILGAVGGGNVIRTTIKNCQFINSITVHIGIVAAGEFRNLMIFDNYFGLSDAGVIPTDFILLSANSHTGHISGNRFATATNATGIITIGTGMIYNPNGTEAGWSTARPA